MARSLKAIATDNFLKPNGNYYVLNKNILISAYEQAIKTIKNLFKQNPWNTALYF